LSLPSDARKTDICDRKTNIESAKLKYNTHMSTPILYKKKLNIDRKLIHFEILKRKYNLYRNILM
jgi:hypothetical protein